MPPTCTQTSQCASYNGTCCSQRNAVVFGGVLVNTTAACYPTNYTGLNVTYTVGANATLVSGTVVTQGVCLANVTTTTTGTNGTTTGTNGTTGGNGTTSGSSNASFLQMTFFALVAVLSVAFF